MPEYRPVSLSDNVEEDLGEEAPLQNNSAASRASSTLRPATFSSSSSSSFTGRAPAQPSASTSAGRYLHVPSSEPDGDDHEDPGRLPTYSAENARPPSLDSAHIGHGDQQGQQHQHQDQHGQRACPPPPAEGSSSSTGSPSARNTERRTQPVQPRDGVFANLSAKPASKAADEEKQDEVPPPYETAAADATPPYFDTTVITTGPMEDEILVEGLPVGSAFVFLWNMLVSMSFQFIGFLLTYLLHTSHAGKNGSRAGLGITLIQYGFYLRSRAAKDDLYGYYGPSDETQEEVLSRAEWLSYIVMVLGWFITIRATSEYIRARKMQAVIAYHPENTIV